MKAPVPGFKADLMDPDIDLMDSFEIHKRKTLIGVSLNDKFYPVVYNKFRTRLEMNLQILRLKPYNFQGHVCTHFSINKFVAYFYYNLIS